MRDTFKGTRPGVWAWSLATVAVAVAVGVVVLNPLWGALADPRMFPPAVQPPASAPIDGLYYIQNAQSGYQWRTQDPLSLWFHPLLSWVLGVLPRWLPYNLWFWALAAVSAAASLPLVWRLSLCLAGRDAFPPGWLMLCLLAPGGLVMATGNAEMPALFFALVLLLSVLEGRRGWLTGLSAALAMLTKPNALYLVPMLVVYFAIGVGRHDRRLWRQALIGIAALLFTWLAWAGVVGVQTGTWDAYWQTRVAEQWYLGTGDAALFFAKLAGALAGNFGLRDLVRYSTALLIPVVSLVVLGVVPLADEGHRYALAAGNLTMLAIAIFMGNPNKILVYSTTLPGHFVAHLLLLRWFLVPSPRASYRRIVGGAAYGLYCLLLVVDFVAGTPLAWYH